MFTQEFHSFLKTKKEFVKSNLSELSKISEEPIETINRIVNEKKTDLDKQLDIKKLVSTIKKEICSKNHIDSLNLNMTGGSLVMFLVSQTHFHPFI